MAIILPACGMILLAYILGAIPWGLVLTRRWVAEDIRSRGSGNIGATNVARVAGKTLGGATLVLDMLKGGLPVFLARVFFSRPPSAAWGEMIIALVIFAAFMGHLYPVFLKFKTGGKGVATAGGCFLVVSPLACLCAMGIFCLVFFSYRRVSAGSLAAAASLPVFIALWGNSPWIVFMAVIVSVFIFIRHRANLNRILNGTEPVFNAAEASGSKSKGPEES